METRQQSCENGEWKHGIYIYISIIHIQHIDHIYNQFSSHNTLECPTTISSNVSHGNTVRLSSKLLYINELVNELMEFN